MPPTSRSRCRGCWSGTSPPSPPRLAHVAPAAGEPRARRADARAAFLIGAAGDHRGHPVRLLRPHGAAPLACRGRAPGLHQRRAPSPAGRVAAGAHQPVQRPRRGVDPPRPGSKTPAPPAGPVARGTDCEAIAVTGNAVVPTRDVPVVDVPVVIVTYNSEAVLGDCLASLPAGRVVVADNESADDTVAVARAAARPVDVVHIGRNAGYAAAVTAGAAHAGDAAAVLVLNPDCRLRPGALEALTRAF